MTKPIDAQQLHQTLWTIAAAPRARRPLIQLEMAIDHGQLDEIRASVGPSKLRDLLELAQAELVKRPGGIRQSHCEQFA